MFGANTRTRLQILEAQARELINSYTKVLEALSAQGGAIKSQQHSLESYNSMVMRHEEQMIFGPLRTKIKIKHNNGEISLPIDQVIQALIDYLGIQYAPGATVPFSFRRPPISD